MAGGRLMARQKSRGVRARWQRLKQFLRFSRFNLAGLRCGFKRRENDHRRGGRNRFTARP
jgi:hypothetical protein